MSARLWRNVGLAVLGCVAATSASVAFRVHAVSTGPVADLAARNSQISAEIALTDDPRVRTAVGTFRRESVVVPATIEILETMGRRLAVHTPIVVFASGGEWRSLLPSQRLRVTGRLGTADHDELVGAIMLVRGPPRVLTGPSPVQVVAGELRAGLRRAADVLPADQRGLLPGLVVGDVSRMDPQVAADFKEAGLSHLTAVSGANLAIVAGAAIGLSRMAGMPLAARAVLAGIAMIAFAIVARPSPSVLRALLMGLVAAVALGTGRPRDGVAGLSASVLLLILFEPALARSYGFALSVSATAGILLLAPRWRDRLAVRLPRWAAEAVAVPAAAQAAVTPVLVLMVGQLSVLAVPANLLAGPAVAPATLLGFAAALVAPLSPAIAQLLVLPAGYAVGWIITVAGHATSVPHANLPWPGGLTGLGLLAVVALVAVPVLRRATWRAVVLTAAVAGGVAVLAVGPVVAPWPPKGWLFVACDVGQGDAGVIAAGAGRGVLVDVGPDAVLTDRCLRRLGIRDIPLIILTHPHADHVGGLEGVFRRGRRVGAVLVTPGRALAQEESTRISAILARRRIPEWVAAPGTQWRFGSAALTVLAPTIGMTPSHTQEGTAVGSWTGAGVTLGRGLEEGERSSLGEVREVATSGGDDRVAIPAGGEGDRRVWGGGAGQPVGLGGDTGHAMGLSGDAGDALRSSGGATRAAGLSGGAAHGVGGGATRAVRLSGGVEHGGRLSGSAERMAVSGGGAREGVTMGGDVGEGGEINNSSVVVHVRWPHGSLMLSGDIETDAQSELLRRGVPTADILKVPHHGSARQDHAFLAAVGARVALISVGADNDYGHPAVPTLSVLHRLGVRVHRTDQSGDLAVIEQGASLAIVGRGS
ncbi:ComEC/Rec2 family competence protein [Nonomuraea sp. NPDC046570]|uniref:ComEC/Rec2 family competence protein n=1 Tax=Nonomuraea sp. NPDC046570 TaxID=3155255 RepID=UPI0033CBD9B2